MSRPILLISLALAACTSAYDAGFADGCYDGGVEGSRWGGVDAALCFDQYPDPGPVGGGPSRYDDGYVDGYEICYVDEYRYSWNITMDALAAEYGECDALL
jgi:hypothetical protein